MVAEDEHQRSVTGKKQTNDAVAFQAVQANQKDAQQWSKKGSEKNEKAAPITKTDHCTFCGKDGHNKEGCFKRIGYPEWWPGKAKREASKPKAAYVETATSPVPGMSNEQYSLFLKLFGGNKPQEESAPQANMAGGLYRMEVMKTERQAQAVSSSTWHKR
ncbi:hypothetical protein HanIR_Chr13g0663421 [Helianthus annuus]|nr:hypothetical protein HanIR_Chr13g0663421 [Helianthus annuus]